MAAVDRFGPSTRDWFSRTFPAPTAAQEMGWPTIASGAHTVIVAPTGSGKTLAAFLWCLDRLASEAPPSGRARCRVLYVSPLKALAHDVERNLKVPLAGIRQAAQRLGLPSPRIDVAIRTGDTSASDRRKQARASSDVLITTPESLYLLLTSQARETLRGVQWVIVDEIHALAATKRGAHLALSLERLESLVPTPFQRIGLSATQKPLDLMGRFLAGTDRSVQIVDAGQRKKLQLEVVVPVDDMTNPAELTREAPPRKGADQLSDSSAPPSPEARSSVWPAIYPALLDLIRAHQTTLVFVNSRRLAERTAQRLNDLAGEELVRAHHGSIARDQRLWIEDALKQGTLRAIIATSSLELGIDMAAIDLVVQVESPPSVAAGLQRVGRAGHSAGAVSAGIIFPKYRGDLLEAAVVTRRMLDGAIESTRVPLNPLDVLAQQVVAACAMDPWDVDALYGMVRGAYSFGGLPRSQFDGVLEMLAGRYPSDAFADLKPRLVWDPMNGTVVARHDARLVAVTSGGTIPDRGLYGVFLGEGGPRVGELDEEMVYESRPGETFVLGATSWRIESITPNRVMVSPAPGEPGKMPFWHGDSVGRPFELGRALGAFTREVLNLDEETATERLREEHMLDDRAARNLLAYLAEQRDATGSIPTDRTVVVERFRDDLGDWRVCVLSPFGGRVHAPWALAVEAGLRRQLGVEAHVIWSDDGFALRLNEAIDGSLESVLFPPSAEVEDLVVDALSGSALFATHFRENAARALLLPRRRAGARTPLWQMRKRAADLLAVTSRYGSFPILLETYRECLQDVFDVPALVDVLRSVEQRVIRVVPAETERASPFASSLLFDYIAAFMYDGDAPLAERRAHALALDRGRLRELLGEEELRELLDPDALASVEQELQSLADRRARSVDQVHDLLRRLGDLTDAEVDARTVNGAAPAWLADLERTWRATRLLLAGQERWVAIEDVARFRDGVGAQPPPGVPDAFLAEASEALEGLLARWARTHAPFTTRDPAQRWGLPAAPVRDALRRLAGRGTVLEGAFRPGGMEREWCDPDVLRSIRRRSLVRLRREVEPVPSAALGRFLPAWQGVDVERVGIDGLLDAIAQIEGAFIPWSVLERDVLALRIRGYSPRLLDELCASGEVIWVGRGALGADDGRVALYRHDRLPLLAPPVPEERLAGPVHDRIRAHLAERGASFFREISAAASPATTADVLSCLWDLVWSSEVTNDTLASLRLRVRPARGSRRPPRFTRIGPPEAAGRWSLVPSTTTQGRRGVTERIHAQVMALLERHGVLMREAMAAEGIAGGFSAVYPILKALEEAGKIRRGYFVEGLGAAQFALPPAVEQLRSERSPRGDSPRAVALASADPANPFGAALPWPRRETGERHSFSRSAGAYVILVDGELALFLERGGKGLSTTTVCDDALRARAAVAALADIAALTPRKELSIERINGEGALTSPLRPALEAAGFRREYLGLVLRIEPTRTAFGRAPRRLGVAQPS